MMIKNLRPEETWTIDGVTIKNCSAHKIKLGIVSPKNSTAPHTPAAATVELVLAEGSNAGAPVARHEATPRVEE